MLAFPAVEQQLALEDVQVAIGSALDEEMLSVLSSGSQIRARMINATATVLFTGVSIAYFGRWLEVGGEGQELEMGDEMQQILRGSVMAVVAAAEDETAVDAWIGRLVSAHAVRPPRRPPAAPAPPQWPLRFAWSRWRSCRSSTLYGARGRRCLRRSRPLRRTAPSSASAPRWSPRRS